MQVKVTVNGDAGAKLIQNKLKQIQAAKTSQLERIGQMQVKSTQDRIRSSKTDPNGRPWAPWSMATLKQRTRQGNVGRGLLYRTGALLTSIAYKVSNGVLTVFSSATYAKYLQFGTPKMPARPFLGFGTEINKIKDTIKEGLK